MNPPIAIQTPIVEMIADVVTATNAIMLPYLQSKISTIERIHYLHGHPKEITTTLANMNTPQAQQFKKYPLIALFQDIVEGVGGTLGNFGTAPLQIIIANQTIGTYKAAERYEKNFKPILLPIYACFMEQLKKSGHFQIQSISDLKHTKIDRVYWGKEGLYGSEKNIFQDLLDCVEIKNLTITVRKTQCTVSSINKINL